MIGLSNDQNANTISSKDHELRPSPQTRYPIPEQTRLVYLKTIIKKRKYGDW